MGIYWGYFMGYKTHRMGPQDSVQLPYKWLNLLRFMVDTTIVNGVYKPTYNWGAPIRPAHTQYYNWICQKYGMVPEFMAILIETRMINHQFGVPTCSDP